MAPSASAYTLLSPAELSYLHSSLALDPPIRPDLRDPTQFRPLIAESDILPKTNGSARICFADGTEAIVGIKAEVERSGTGRTDDVGDFDTSERPAQLVGQDSWVEMTIDIPGIRDDDPLPVFLAALLHEGLMASEELADKLWINRRFHWKLYIDILHLSPPLSYPLPLLSLTVHLALLSTRLPKLVSENDEDPSFDDDWEASNYLYARDKQFDSSPSVTLLVMAVGDNIIFDPTREELAVADVVLAVSFAASFDSTGRTIRLLAVRTIDPPSRLTPPGVPDALNTATGAVASTSSQQAWTAREALEKEGVWSPPRGGVKRGLIKRVIALTVGKGGIADEVLDGLKTMNSEGV